MTGTPASRAFGIAFFAFGLVVAVLAVRDALTGPVDEDEPAGTPPAPAPPIIIVRQTPATPGAPDATIMRCPGGAAAAVPDTPPQQWFTAADYPAAALRQRQHGVVGIVYRIDANGRIDDCSVNRSSGVPALDQASCDLLVRRASFTPAHDGDGCPIPSRAFRTVRWQIPAP